VELPHAVGNEAGMIAQCLGGDQHAWHRLFCHHQKQLIKTIIAQLGAGRYAAAQVEEILADVWYVLLVEDYRHLRAYDPRRGSLPTYLQALARQQCQRWRQRRARQSRHLVPLADPERIAAPSASVPCGLRWEEFCSALTPTEREYVQECLAAPTTNEPSPRTAPPRKRKRKQRVVAKLRAVMFSN
jgi:DNA-directed RNA polymerase specialized sigma24 family protein